MSYMRVIEDRKWHIIYLHNHKKEELVRDDKLVYNKKIKYIIKQDKEDIIMNKIR